MLVARGVAAKAAFLFERLHIFAANGFRRRGLWLVDIANAGVDITQTEVFRAADIVHLHWVNQGFLSLSGLQRIIDSGKPVVWTLHDLWPVTGICHHPGSCEGYVSTCHDCPLLQRPSRWDLSARVFARKAELYGRGRIHFVAVSSWTAEMARRSALLGCNSIDVIPNALPTDIFCPGNKTEARRGLGLPEGKSIIAFGAARIDEPAKGLDKLYEAIGMLRREDMHLVLFGDVKDGSRPEGSPCETTYLGNVTDPKQLCSIYRAADVLVNASDFETFGQTLAEAQACGCVPVSFDRGGQRDIISHLHDGYLAHSGDVADLASGIAWALNEPPSAEVLRAKAMRFSDDSVARQYIALYEGYLESLEGLEGLKGLESLEGLEGLKPQASATNLPTSLNLLKPL